MMRSLIDHKKVLVLALNGPGVGGGAAWFQGVADIVLAAEGAWLQVPFNALGLVPENGSALMFAQSMGLHRANEFLMFGRRVDVAELEQYGMVNRVFPVQDFQGSVMKYLQGQLDVNDGKSMVETKRLQNASLRDARLVAVWNSIDALAERFVEDAPKRRFEDKRRELEGMSSRIYQGCVGTNITSQPSLKTRRRKFSDCCLYGLWRREHAPLTCLSGFILDYLGHFSGFDMNGIKALLGHSFPSRY
jgi:Enoyl-CoA hydratase/isomerase